MYTNFFHDQTLNYRYRDKFYEQVKPLSFCEWNRHEMSTNVRNVSGETFNFWHGIDPRVVEQKLRKYLVKLKY